MAPWVNSNRGFFAGEERYTCTIGKVLFLSITRVDTDKWEMHSIASMRLDRVLTNCPSPEHAQQAAIVFAKSLLTQALQEVSV